MTITINGVDYLINSQADLINLWNRFSFTSSPICAESLKVAR